MNKTMQRVGLLMLSMVSACAADEAPPLDEAPAPSVPVAAPSIPTAAPRPRDGAPFSRTVREQLAKRGIHVHDGSKPAQGERTTVEEKWIVPGYPMSRITENDPDTVPLRYTAELGVIDPRFVTTGPDAPFVDPAQPGKEAICSGTVVAGDSVLTAAHCVINWKEIGKDLTTGAPVKRKVRAYAIKVRPRRNGADIPHGEHNVRKSYWSFNNWPSATDTGDAKDYDYAILRIATPPPLGVPTTTIRSLESPAGTSIEFGHYPFAFSRQHALYYSVGDIDTTDDGLLDGSERVYRHRAGAEPGSSGAGVFKLGENGVVGVISFEEKKRAGVTRVPDQRREGFPNRALMFTPTEIAQINGWLAAPNR